MFKLGQFNDDESVPVVRPAVFARETTIGFDRLCIAVPSSSPALLSDLSAGLDGPFYVLYVLHTPRGGSPSGRYQSPLLSPDQLQAFLTTHHAFFATDGRHDVWVHSSHESATLVWDRHEIIYAYGALDLFQQRLTQAGFTPGVPAIPVPHSHHYHEEFDPEERTVLEAFSWHHTDLRPEDEQ